MMTPGEFAVRLRLAAVKAKVEIDVPTKIVVQHAAEQARAVLGTYAYGWPPLKPATIAQKTTGDSPLLETGEMRSSISSKTQLTIAGAEGLIYSDDKIAVYQELGTSRGIPPRPFLMTSLVRSTPKMEEAFTAFIGSLFL